MSDLCTSCLENGANGNSLTFIERGVWTKKKQCLDESSSDPVCLALRNLQAKIRVLEVQRSEQAGKAGPNSCSPIASGNNNNKCSLNPDCNHSTVIIPDDDQLPWPASDHCKNDSDVVPCQMEKNLAADALRMAEKRCQILENQLSAMKRIFLKKIAKDSDPPSGNSKLEEIKSKKYATKNTLKDSLKETKTMNDLESLYSFNVDAAENISNETDSVTFNLHLDDIIGGGLQKSESFEKGNNSNKNAVVRNVSTKDYQHHRTSKSRSIAQVADRVSIDHPFILGCSTSNSYNSNVTKPRTGKPGLYKVLKTATNINAKQLAEACVNNLRSIYSELCSEYEYLLSKKVRILELLTRVRGRELLEQRQYLDDIAQTLPLKREQIRKMKTMINNFNEAFKTDGSNIRLDT